MEKAKNKIYYSRNEKILRAIVIFGILLAIIAGILLLVLSKVLPGIIVLVVSIICCVAISPLCIRPLKNKFYLHRKKRVIYAFYYALVIVLVLGCALIAAEFSTYDYEDIRPSAIEFVESNLKKDYVNYEIINTDIDCVEYGDGYYFCMETELHITEVGGAVTTRYPLSYIKVNKYTGKITVIDDQLFDTALINAN